MARPKRQGEWVPVTVRMDADAAQRLRVAAARRGVTMGALLDQIILDHFPAVDPEPRVGRTRPKTDNLTTARLGQELDRLGANQSVLARMIGITPRAVSEWFEREQIPAARQESVRMALSKLRAIKDRQVR